MDETKKEFKIIPNDGSYYTIHNVENDLPKIPVNPINIVKPLSRYGSSAGFYDNLNNDNNNVIKNNSNNLIAPGSPNFPMIPQQPKDPLTRPTRFGRQSNSKNQKDAIQIPWFIRPIVSTSVDRANGKAARVYKVGLKSPEGKTRDVYIILLFYQTIIGAIGGIAVGLETSYLTPPTPTQSILGTELGKQVIPSFLTGIKFAWRSFKRATVAGLLFNFVHKNIEESRSKSDWKNSAYAGAMCGSLFGLRGGLRGTFMGCTLFAAFGGMSGILDDIKKKNRAK